jgi:hypothetical protein
MVSKKSDSVPESVDFIDLMCEYLLYSFDVLIDITTWFVNFMEEEAFLL